MGWNPSQGSYVSLLSAANQSSSSATPYASPIINTQIYTCYSFQMNAYCGSQSTAGAPMVSQVLLTWFADPLGQLPIWQERWWGWLGNSSPNASPLLGAGAIRGPYMQVKVQNVSATANITINSIALFGNGLPFVGDSDWRQNVPGAISGSGFSEFSPGNAFGDDNLLFSVAGFVPTASVVLWQPLPLSAGPLYLRFSTSANLGGASVLASAAALVNGIMAAGVGCPGTLIAGFNTAGESELNCIAPHAPCFLVINVPAAAPTITAAIVSSKVTK